MSDPETLRKNLQICVNALLAVQQAYQDFFEVMPVAWQTYDDIVSEALEEAGVLETDKRRRQP